MLEIQKFEEVYVKEKDMKIDFNLTFASTPCDFFAFYIFFKNDQ